MSLNIDPFLNPYKKLETLARTSSAEVKILKDLFQELKNLYANFAGSLRSLSEKFHKDISQNNNNDERVYPYYQFLANHLLKISETNKEFSREIDTIIYSPYHEFSTHINNANFEGLEKTSKLLANIQSSANSLKAAQDDYYSKSRTVEKLQDSLNKLIEEDKLEDLINKTQEKQQRVKIEVQDASNLYTKEINNHNQIWKNLYANFPSVFKLYDDSEENRCYFTQNTISNLLKFFNGFYLKTRNESHQVLEEKLKEFDSKFKSKSYNQNLKKDSFKNLTSGTLDDTLQKQPFESYLSYDTKKTMDEIAIMEYIEKEEYTIIYGASNELDLQFVLSFAKNFWPKTKNQQTELTISALNNFEESMTTADESSMSMSGSKDLAKLALPLTLENKVRFDEILQVPANRKYLLENLVKRRKLKKNIVEVRLVPKVFDFLNQYLDQILPVLFKEQDYDNLTLFLPLTIKYSTNRGPKLEYLYESSQTKPQWQNSTIWLEIVKALIEKRNYEETLKQKKMNEMEKKQAAAPLVNKLWSFGMKKLTSALEVQKPKSTTLERDIYYPILKEACFYLSKLVPNFTFAFDILNFISQELAVPIEDTRAFVNLYQRYSDELITKKLTNHKEYKKATNANKWKQLYPVYLALDYLEPRDLTQLLSLDSATRKLFTKKVYRTIFYNFGEQLTQNQRLQIWQNALQIHEVKIEYQEFYDNLRKSIDPPVTKHDDVIKLDVARSFNNHSTFDPQVLQGMLRAYALLDKNLSYCQGMNYIMGFCYINIKDPNTTFKCFVRLMERFIKPVFENEFKILKRNFFQFNRLTQIYLPDLYAHFKRENIEPSFFLPSWFITIFTSHFQYTQRSKLLEKIWDFFVIDGFKAVFKAALLILIEYKQKLLSMKFDKILHFLGDLSKHEVFTNIKYFEAIEKKQDVSNEFTREFDFIKNFGSLMRNLSVTNEILVSLDADFDVMEGKLPKLSALKK